MTETGDQNNQLVKIISYEGNLYTEQGMPLYRFAPVGRMAAEGQEVPWGSTWEPYVKAWVLTYVPLPRATSDTPFIHDSGQLTTQSRAAAGKGRQYDQAVYRGWPLYTYALDTPGFQFEPQGTIPGLFEMVGVEEPIVKRGVSDDENVGEKPFPQGP